MLRRSSQHNSTAKRTCGSWGVFASNIARLITLAKIARKTGRYMGLYGRSLMNMYGIARQQGIWPDDLPVADAHHLGYLPPKEVWW